MVTTTRFADHFADWLVLTDQGRGVSFSSNAYDTQIAKYQRISPTGAAIVESSKRMVGGGFVGSLDTVAWAPSNSGAGSSATAANNIASVVSGSANSGYGAISSTVKSRFLYASVNNFRGTFRLAAIGGANNTRVWGAFNFGVTPAILNGFYFSYDGNTSTLSLKSSNGGIVSNTVSSGSFNGEVTSYTLDTSAHNYEIIYQVAGVWFFIDGVFLHKFPLSSSPSILSGDYALTTAAASLNSVSGTVTETLEIWAMSIVRFGAAEPSPQYFHIGANGTYIIKIGPSTLHKISVNAAGSNNNVLTIYDNTAGSGTVVAVINSPASGSVATLEYGVDMSNGLTIVATGTTSGDFTIVFD